MYGDVRAYVRNKVTGSHTHIHVIDFIFIILFWFSFGVYLSQLILCSARDLSPNRGIVVVLSLYSGVMELVDERIFVCASVVVLRM